jgi:hypothetical protein
MIALQKIGAAEAAPHALPAKPSLAWPRHATPSSATLPYHKKLSRVLDRMGSVYLVQDILAAIAENRMQSFCVGNSWAITQVVDFPRAKVLQLVAYVGDLKDVDALHQKIIDFADEANVGLLSTYGRPGWLREGSWQRLGWKLKAKNYLYHREM